MVIILKKIIKSLIHSVSIISSFFLYLLDLFLFHSFVLSLLRADIQPTLDLSAETILSPVHLPRERRGIGRCVQCVCRRQG